MAAQITSTTVDWSFEDTETVVITRTTIAGYPPAPVTATIYSGPGDFQDSAQSIKYNPAGEVEMATAEVIIDPSSTGVLPVVLAGDTVSIGGSVWGIVVSATVWTATPRHLEVTVKRGPVGYSL